MSLLRCLSQRTLVLISCLLARWRRSRLFFSFLLSPSVGRSDRPTPFRLRVFGPPFHSYPISRLFFVAFRFSSSLASDHSSLSSFPSLPPLPFPSHTRSTRSHAHTSLLLLLCCCSISLIDQLPATYSENRFQDLGGSVSIFFCRPLSFASLSDLVQT
jgi:hypothetical protein